MKILATILVTVVMLSASIISTDKKQKVTATVVNVSSDSGKVSFALYNKETFMKTPLQAKTAKIVDGKSTVVFDGIDAGEYAVICFHDKNN